MRPPANARVSTRTLPLWRIRLGRELPRCLLAAASLLGILASARFAIAPPEPVGAPALRTPAGVDPAAQSYAVRFARSFLAWGPGTVAGDEALESFVGEQLEPEAGLVPPTRGQERVQWAEAVASRRPEPAVEIFTVAAETEPLGMRYLDVPVARESSGALALAGYPAFVGPPASASAIAPPRRQAVRDAALAQVVRRALGNYLSDSAAELAADLAEGARVSSPAPGLRLLSVTRLDWAYGGGAVVASTRASDALGATYTLSYELDVLRHQGRWEIAAIETDPDA
jgi:hypothetical protein